jgi:hypothetical protein
MATLPLAERAREIWSEYLRRLGAFGVGVTDFGERTGYGVEALFSEPPPVQLPVTLGVYSGGIFIQVPLRWRLHGGFEPE